VRIYCKRAQVRLSLRGRRVSAGCADLTDTGWQIGLYLLNRADLGLALSQYADQHYKSLHLRLESRGSSVRRSRGVWVGLAIQDVPLRSAEQPVDCSPACKAALPKGAAHLISRRQFDSSWIPSATFINLLPGRGARRDLDWLVHRSFAMDADPVYN